MEEVLKISKPKQKLIYANLQKNRLNLTKLKKLIQISLI